MMRAKATTQRFGSGVAVPETVTPQGRGVRAYTDVFTACLRNSHARLPEARCEATETQPLTAATFVIRCGVAIP